MNIFLATTTSLERHQSPIPEFEKLAQIDKFKVHHLTDDLDAADIILFADAHQHTDWKIDRICKHPIRLTYPDKALIYDQRPRPWGSLPGIYVNMPKSNFEAKCQRAFGYSSEINSMLAADRDQVPSLLFSFMGARTHKIRDRVLQISHPRAYIEDTSHINFFNFSEFRDEGALQAQKKRFAEVVGDSKFVLCPRGHGTSSIRLYEVMAAGRVPVIISDEWLAPSGPDWSRCSFRVKESEIETIPEMLERNEARYAEMATAAHSAYQEWFAPDVKFHRLAQLCQGLLESGAACHLTTSYRLKRQYLRCGLSQMKGNVVNFLGAFKTTFARTRHL